MKCVLKFGKRYDLCGELDKYDSQTIIRFADVYVELSTVYTDCAGFLISESSARKKGTVCFLTNLINLVL